MISPTIKGLGVVDGVSVSVAVTDEPWALDVDTLVVSVGASLGNLGVMLARTTKTAAR